jgi:D-alanine-D-alanine ligase
MLVGLTYDLRDDYLKEGFTEEQTAEFDRESTIKALDDAIKSNGYTTERIGNIKALTKKLADGRKWDLVFNICEGLYGKYSRESQVPALLDAYNIPYTFSDPLMIAVSLKKDLTKIIAQSFGVKTPAFAVINTKNDIDKINLEYPLFVKPIAEGTSKGVTSRSKVSNKQELHDSCIELLDRFNQPVLVETYCTGREFTCGIIGTGENAQYIGSLEVVLKGSAEKNAYTYKNKENCEELIEYRLLTDDSLNEKIKALTLKIWNIFGFRDAGRLDFMIDSNGELNFIEANPLAGLHPEHSDLPILCSKAGIKYNDLIGRIIKSALQRAAK